MILVIMDSSIPNFVLVFCFALSVTAHKCNVTFPPTSIDCTGLGMETLPEHLKDHIAVIMIFSHNKLNSTTSFHDWENLRSLDVSYNLIKNISAVTFKDLINLKVLNMSYNGIEIITEDAFNNLGVLEVVDLSGNPIVGHDDLRLQKLLNGTLYRSLKKFVMEYSELCTLPETFFDYAFELQYLDLSHNNLTHIPKLPKSLMYLDLSYNYLTTINIVPFHILHSLRNIFLEYNTQLHTIDDNAFETTTNLRNVSLKGCKKLTSLPPNLFFFNKEIKYLSIADCNLKTLPKQYRNVLSRIPSLELEDNPWVCNATIKWFLTLGPPTVDNVRCNKPNNATIMEYYGANYHHTALRYLLIALILAVFILFGAGIYLSFSKEKKRRMQTPYVPLNGKHPLHNPVYITTVV